MHCELLVPGLFSGDADGRFAALELLLARARRRHGTARTVEGWLQDAFELGDAPFPAGALTLLAGGGDPAVLAFLKGRIDNNLAIVDKRLSTRPFVLGARPTIADLSLAAYLYYPADEFGFDIPGQHKHIAVWLDRIKALPGWEHPYDLMPGHPLPGR